MDHIPLSFLKNSQRGPQLLYRMGLGWLVGGMILLLTTTGRKSGLARTTALQYEKCGSVYLVASFRGSKADWFRNLAACPKAVIQVGRLKLDVNAKLTQEPDELEEFMGLRLKRHPVMVGGILRLEGINPRDRQSMKAYASRLALAELTPVISCIQTLN